jgi:transcriptional regulator with XRE-family HTH domain
VTLGEKIKKLRKDRKWSQGQLAEMLGVHVTHVSRIETGRYAPSLELLKKLAETLDVTTDFLLYESTSDQGSVMLEDKSLYERMKLIEELEERDRAVILGVIEAFLTKHHMREVLEGQKLAG